MNCGCRQRSRLRRRRCRMLLAFLFPCNDAAPRFPISPLDHSGSHAFRRCRAPAPSPSLSSACATPLLTSNSAHASPGPQPAERAILTMRPLLFSVRQRLARHQKRARGCLKPKNRIPLRHRDLLKFGGLVIRGVCSPARRCTQFPRHFFTISRTFFSSVTSQRAASASTPCDANSATTARASRADS